MYLQTVQLNHLICACTRGCAGCITLLKLCRSQHCCHRCCRLSCQRGVLAEVQAVAAMEEKQDFEVPQKRQQDPPQQQGQQQQRRALLAGKQPLYSSSKAQEPAEAAAEAEFSVRRAAPASAAATGGPPAAPPDSEAATNPFASPSVDTTNPFLTTAPAQTAPPPARASGLSIYQHHPHSLSSDFLSDS